MHQRLAQLAARTLPIAIRSLPVPVPKMEQAMQWHQHRTSDSGLRSLRALLKEAAEAMDHPRDATRRTALLPC